MAEQPTRLGRELLLATRVFKVFADRLAFQGREHTWYVLEHPGAVVIVPVDAQGHVWFVRQYRHAIGDWLLEFPAGTLQPDEAPLACAQRELAEELGAQAAQWFELGSFYVAPGYSSERMWAFLAYDLKPVTGYSLDPDEILRPERYPVAQVEQWIAQGALQDGKSLAAWLLALRKARHVLFRDASPSP